MLKTAFRSTRLIVLASSLGVVSIASLIAWLSGFADLAIKSISSWWNSVVTWATNPATHEAFLSVAIPVVIVAAVIGVIVLILSEL